MLEINKLDYIDCYDQATGEKMFRWEAPKERPTLKNRKGQMLNWIMGIIYRKEKKLKDRFKIIIRIDDQGISSYFDVDRDCNVLGVEWSFK